MGGILKEIKSYSYQPKHQDLPRRQVQQPANLQESGRPDRPLPQHLREQEGPPNRPRWQGYQRQPCLDARQEHGKAGGLPQRDGLQD